MTAGQACAAPKASTAAEPWAPALSAQQACSLLSLKYPTEIHGINHFRVELALRYDSQCSLPAVPFMDLLSFRRDTAAVM